MVGSTSAALFRRYSILVLALIGRSSIHLSAYADSVMLCAFRCVARRRG
jgi:hypothetical protein